jgi:hypothetical protein
MGLLGQVVATVSFTPQLPIVYSYALYRQTIVFIFLDTFSMSSSLVPKLVVPAFGKGKFIRVMAAKEN